MKQHILALVLLVAGSFAHADLNKDIKACYKIMGEQGTEAVTDCLDKLNTAQVAVETAAVNEVTALQKQYKTKYPDAAPLYAGDPAKAQEAFGNYLNNMCRYETDMGQGAIWAELECVMHARAQRLMELKVQSDWYKKAM